MNSCLIKGKKLTASENTNSSLATEMLQYKNKNKLINLKYIYFIDYAKKEKRKKKCMQPWLVWLSALSAGLRSEGLLVRSPVRAEPGLHARFPPRGCTRGNCTLMVFSLSPTLPFSENK